MVSVLIPTKILPEDSLGTRRTWGVVLAVLVMVPGLGNQCHERSQKSKRTKFTLTADMIPHG